MLLSAEELFVSEAEAMALALDVKAEVEEVLAPYARGKGKMSLVRSNYGGYCAIISSHDSQDAGHDDPTTAGTWVLSAEGLCPFEVARELLVKAVRLADELGGVQRRVSYAPPEKRIKPRHERITVVP